MSEKKQFYDTFKSLMMLAKKLLADSVKGREMVVDGMKSMSILSPDNFYLAALPFYRVMIPYVETGRKKENMSPSEVKMIDAHRDKVINDKELIKRKILEAGQPYDMETERAISIIKAAWKRGSPSERDTCWGYISECCAIVKAVEAINI